MKKFAVLLLAVAALMLVCGISGAEEPITGTCGENLTWTLVNNVLTISGTGEMTITGNAPWDGNRADITTVVIDSGVTSIGNNAFFNHSSLTSVSIPGSVTKIGGGAFMNCLSLAGIALPDNLTDIGRLAFAHCISLESVTIPNGVTGIGHNAFQECTSLKSITIPDSVTSIGDEAFMNCSSLAGIALPDNLTDIGQLAFAHCSSLESVTIPNGVTDIGDSAFQNCSSLERVSIPDSVTSIGDGAFSDCGSSLRIRCEKESEAWTYATANGIPVECVTHGDLSYYPKVEPSCTTAGNIEYWECADCGIKFSDEAATAVIDGSVTTEALGHDWSKITYTWADDYSSVTASRSCSRCDKTKTETVTDITATPFAPTCTEKGGTKYTSGSFENTAFTAQAVTVSDIPANGHTLQEHEKVEATCTKAGTEAYWECTVCGKLFSDADGKNAIGEPVTIAKLGHSWGETTYTWNDDYSEVTATRVCGHDASHKETETVKTTSKVSKAATCTAKGQTTYTATFTKAAFAKQTKTVSNIAAKGHTLKKHAKVAATCTKAGTEAYWECTVCGKLFSDAKGKNAIDKPVVIAKLGHKWGAVEYTWSEDLSKVTATRVCENDKSHKETETVAVTCKIKEATTKKDGSKVYTSKAFKNKAFKVQTKTIVIPKYPATYEDKNCKYKIKDNLTAVVTGPAKTTLTKVTIPDTITVQEKEMKVVGIADNAFKGLKKLNTVTIGKNVKDIGKNAFSGCGKLKTITIKSELLTKSSVKSTAFKGINAKATIKVPKAKKKEYEKFLYKKGVPKTAKIK